MILINCNQEGASIKNFWNNIHFHPTDAIEDTWGQAILDSVANDKVAKTIRMYAMLEDIVTMDNNGQLHYDFSENDARIDYIISRGFEIFLSYNFLPPCIAENTGYTQHASKNGTRYKGKTICTSRLKDDFLWEEICYNYTKHLLERYGLTEIKKWHFQCYNEPDIPMFFLSELEESPENLDERVQEYLRLYRGFSKAVERVSPTLKVGGPASAGRLAFCEKFLDAVKSEGLKFDFFSGHAYGTEPQKLNDGTGPLDIKSVLKTIKDYQSLMNSYFPDKEIIIDEWGASSCGFYDRDECPKLLFREGSEFASYYGKLIEGAISEDLRISHMMICLSGQHSLPCDFSGCRNFMGKNLIKKPIYNAYALMNKLGERRVNAKTDIEGLTVLATSNGQKKYTAMLSYSSEHFDEMLQRVTDKITFQGINGLWRIKAFCIDEEHTNPYKFAKQMNWGDHFSEEQIKRLKEIAALSPILEYTENFDEETEIPISFTTNALLLIEITKLN